MQCDACTCILCVAGKESLVQLIWMGTLVVLMVIFKVTEITYFCTDTAPGLVRGLWGSGRGAPAAWSRRWGGSQTYITRQGAQGQGSGCSVYQDRWATPEQVARGSALAHLWIFPVMLLFTLALTTDAVRVRHRLTPIIFCTFTVIGVGIR